MQFQKTLLSTFFTLKEETDFFKDYILYDRGTDEHIVEHQLILEDILTYI